MKQQFRTVKQALQSVPLGWWIVLLTLPALVPLARIGFFDSHDGLFHVYRLAALDRAVRAGVLYPRWFPEFAFGYGHPVLNFYGPLSYYWGLPFTLLGADAALALKLVLASGLIASALGMYLFARLHLARPAALVAAVVYAYLPYHLVDLYVRGAVAEFLSFVWFPLVLWAFHRLVEEPETHRLTQVALAALLLAALVLTHSLSAFIFAPVLAAYVLVSCSNQRDRPALGRAMPALALAVACEPRPDRLLLAARPGRGAVRGPGPRRLAGLPRTTSCRWPTCFRWARPTPTRPSRQRAAGSAPGLGQIVILAAGPGPVLPLRAGGSGRCSFSWPWPCCLP